MNKTRESKHSTGTAEEADKKEKYRRTRKFGALVLSVIAAVGIGHKLGEPAMSPEQMDRATSIAAEAVSGKMGEFEGEKPVYVDESGDYSSYRNEKGDRMSVFAYNISSEYRDPITNKTKDPGTYVRVSLENDSIRGKHDKKGTLSDTEFTFKSDDPQDLNNLVADGKLTIEEAKDFINSGRASISEISSLDDINGDDTLIEETLDDVDDDDRWRLEVDKKDGVSGVDRDKDGLSGESAVAQVQRVVDMVRENNWGESN